MKFLVCVLMLASLSAMADSKIAKPVQKTPTIPLVPGDKMAGSTKPIPLVPGDKKAAVADCDKAAAAAKTVDVKAETLSLSNNSTGCSLDSAK